MGFLNPGALWFAALLLALLLLHLWEVHRRRVDVPSLLLWQVVPEARLRSKRPRVDWLFLLQMILLALLIGGLAQPYIDGVSATRVPTRHIFVLDVSASMQVREGRHTRFDDARNELRKDLIALPARDEAMLMTAGHQARVLKPFSRDRSGLIALLDEVEPVDTGTNLELALAIAQSAAAGSELPVRIAVFTDLSPSQLDAKWRDQVRVISFGESDDNLAIEALRVQQGRFDDYARGHARVVVHNFSHREAHALLQVDLDGEILSREGFSLAPRASRSFLLRGLPGPGTLRADLQTDDALEVDNKAYGWVRPIKPVRVLVHTDSAALRAELRRVAEATPYLEFRFQPSKRGTAEMQDDTDLDLFHRSVPKNPPARPALYSHPPRKNDRFAVTGELAELEIADWNELHPAIGTLRPALPHPLVRVSVVDAPPWAESLLVGGSGERQIPLVFAGEDGGQRVACLAFDLAEQRLLSADRMNLLLLLLNLIDWLVPQDDSVTVVRTGEAQVLAGLAADARQIVDPRGRILRFPPGGPHTLDPIRIGEYVIGSDGTRHRILANLFDPVESDTGRPARSSPGPQPVSGATARDLPGSSFATWLYWLAAAFFLIEWIAWRRTG